MKAAENYSCSPSSLNKHKIFILFSHSNSLVLLLPTRSLIKVGQLWGHSCFKTVMRVRFSLPMKGLVWGEMGREDISITFVTM